MTYYMHTMDGKPASFNNGSMILLSTGVSPVRLVASFAEIKSQRRTCTEIRKALGWLIPNYGHKRVITP